MTVATCAKCKRPIIRQADGRWGTPERPIRGCYHRPQPDTVREVPA